MNITTDDSWYDLFISILQAAHLGVAQVKGTQLNFRPRLLRPYDLLKKREKVEDEFDRLLATIDPKFFDVAKSEMYRTKRGWIGKAISSGDARTIILNDESYVVPRFSKARTVGVDSSAAGPLRLIGIFSVPDELAAEFYFDKHLKLPKTHNHAEWKWSRLNASYKQTVSSNFKATLSVCCEAALLVETDVLSNVKGHFKDRITNLIEGCFSGYERTEGERRRNLRNAFFSIINNTPVHCDPDFHPVSSEDFVRMLVRQLAKADSQFREFTPLNVPLRSHESRTIQIADILVGALKEARKKGNPLEPFNQLSFDKRKIRRFGNSTAKAFYFLAEESTGSGAINR